jgi:hypothetical protein
MYTGTSLIVAKIKIQNKNYIIGAFMSTKLNKKEYD